MTENTSLIPLNTHAIAGARNDGRQSLHWCGEIELLSSLCHGAGTSGNVQIFNCEKTLSGGRVVKIPFVTGNAMKHKVIRRCGIDGMIRYLGLDGQLTRACLQLLYSGGFLSAKGSSVDLGAFFDLAQTIPILGLLGGSLGNVIQESRVQVDHAVLICKENAWRLPASATKDKHLPSAAECRDVIAYTRGDPTKQAKMLTLMTQGVAGEAAQVMDSISRAKSDRAKDVQPEGPAKSGSTQMRYETEVVVAGAKFWWEIRLHDALPVEVGALFHALTEFARNPYIGGASAKGHGKVRINMDKWSVDPLSTVAASTVARPSLDAYQAHLDDNRDAVTKALKGIK
jgi:CRISPR type IV-associated protein Csf2